MEEAYDDTGTLAEIMENGQIQPLEFILVQNTSPLQKVNEESLTYLNQGQAYGVRLKRRNRFSKTIELDNSIEQNRFSYLNRFEKANEAGSVQADATADGLSNSNLLEVRTFLALLKSALPYALLKRVGDKPDQPGLSKLSRFI